MYAEDIGLSPSQIEDYNARLQELRNEGQNVPNFHFSVSDYRSEAEISAESLPDLVKEYGVTADLSIFKLWKETENPLWNNVAIFLTRLLNDSPRVEEKIDERLKAVISKYILEMENEYQTKKEESRINALLSAATTAIGTCIDKVKVGYMLLQSHGNQEAQEKIGQIQAFVEGVHTGAILYDEVEGESESCFKTCEELEIELSKEDEGLAGNLKEIRGNEGLSVGEKTKFIAFELKQKKPSLKFINISDEVEDILKLIYAQPDFSKLHQLTMSYESCCSLKGKYFEAAKTYLHRPEG
eukprot:COSAG01_NODE_10987_length_2032_cov_1.685463_2_plen_298_part_00